MWCRHALVIRRRGAGAYSDGVRGGLNPITRERRRRNGEVLREFDVNSAFVVLASLFGGLFLVFFLASFLPWLLSEGMTAAVEGMMHQVGFEDFTANTLWDWLLVLLIGAVFVAVLVSVVLGLLTLYNLFSDRTGVGLLVQPPALDAPARRAVESGKSSSADATFDGLYAEAKRRKIPGRSVMSKAELAAAVQAARAKRTPTTTRGRRSAR